MVKRPRACDRCHRYKERCIFQGDADSCDLCQDSASVCTTRRAHGRRGRRPQAKSLGPNSWIQSWEMKDEPVQRRPSLVKTAADLSASTASELGDLPLQSPFDSSPGILERFAAKYDLFMIGPSFAARFRVALQHAYTCAPQLLQDIFTVVFTALKYGEHYTSIWQQLNTSKGAASLQLLRTVRVAKREDAFAVIALGQSLAAFELLTNCTGSISILRYSLLSIKPWYRELSSDPSLDPVIIGPIFWDTVSCLVRREIPVVKFLCRGSQMIDHSAGLCTTLLPILFDLCLAGNAHKNKSQSGSQVDDDLVKKVEQKLLTWTPEEDGNLASDFTRQETLAMMAQATMYQTAGLLIAHRILNPIGIFDDAAIYYAETILQNFRTFSVLAGSGTKMPYVAFPMLMAMFEVPNVPCCIWESITLLAAAPVCAAKLSNLVEYVWAERRRGFQGCIFDLVESGPECTIVP